MTIKKTLPLKFKKKGVYYSQIKREGDFAILSLRYAEKGRIVGYDVVTISRYSPEKFNAKFAQLSGEQGDFVECFPSSEQYGSKAWSFNTLISAENKFQELINVSVSK